MVSDDMEGGCPIFPRFVKNNKMIGVVSASVLLEKVKPENAKGSLKDLLTNLREDDNQVIQVILLKDK